MTILALFPSIPIIIDTYLAYKSISKTQKQLIEKLIDKAPIDKLDIEELKEFIKQIGKAPPGIPGLSRATMALTVILILGVAVFHVLVIGVSGDSSQNINSQIVNNVLSMLAGLLAAITGFYFGSRTAEKKEEEKK